MSTVHTESDKLHVLLDEGTRLVVSCIQLMPLFKAFDTYRDCRTA